MGDGGQGNTSSESARERSPVLYSVASHDHLTVMRVTATAPGTADSGSLLWLLGWG